MSRVGSSRVTHLARILVQSTSLLYFPHPLANPAVSALDDVSAGSHECVKMGETILVLALRTGLVNLRVHVIYYCNFTRVLILVVTSFDRVVSATSSVPASFTCLVSRLTEYPRVRSTTRFR